MSKIMKKVLSFNSIFLKKKIALTLSEVLITLAVIGVVAAITIPTLFIKYQKQETVAKLKKSYSALSQVINKSQIINGHYSTWDYDIVPSDFFNKYLKDFVIIDERKVSQEAVKRYELDGSNLSLWIFQEKGGGTSFSFADGTKIFVADSFSSPNTNATRSRKSFVIDINGDKKPNRMGKDLFLFSLHKTKGLVPHYVSDGDDMATMPFKTREQLINGDNTGYRYHCKKGARGEWCAALIMVDDWEIRSDYPW